MGRTRGWRRQWTEPEADESPESPLATPGPAPTRIEADCEIEGDFSLDRPLEVEGEFRGSITCSAEVVIGEAGCVEAGIEGRTVNVHGAVVGDITARREIVLHATARVHGKLTAPSVVIERGAFYRGETQMYRPEQRLASVAPPETPGA